MCEATIRDLTSFNDAMDVYNIFPLFLTVLFNPVASHLFVSRFGFSKFRPKGVSKVQ